MTKSVLVVDDQSEYVQLFREFLEVYGYTVTTHESAQNALDDFKARPFDVVITDVLMPGMDGIKLLDELRAIRPEVPAIVVSAFTTEEQRFKALQSGASLYLDKPVSLATLKSSVDMLVNSSSN